MRRKAKNQLVAVKQMKNMNGALRSSIRILLSQRITKEVSRVSRKESTLLTS